MIVAQEGDLALYVDLRDGKRRLVRLQAGGAFHTHRGLIRHDDCIGQPWGRLVRTQLDARYLVLEPSTAERLQYLKRNSQIMFPKDVGYLLLKLGVRPGRLIVEAGTGSGGMTLALALATAPLGRVVSYDVRPEMQAIAVKNLERNCLPPDLVAFKVRDIAEGLDETEADAFFLDVSQPWDYLAQVAASLRGGAFFATVLPTMNQVVKTVEGLEAGPYGMIEVEELLLRPYKPVSNRVRPADRMVAHTVYLIFARRLAPSSPVETCQTALASSDPKGLQDL
ncbi:MAG: tRNA (adenine-N1)-methyltransferase [Thermoflexales bacterium]|nr:tRNA (adenine-N1)-methyltransferase [Thermoflexales bacterium]